MAMIGTRRAVRADEGFDGQQKAKRSRGVAARGYLVGVGRLAGSGVASDFGKGAMGHRRWGRRTSCSL